MSTVTIEIPEEFTRCFGEGKWSTRRAAEFAGLDRWQFMEVLMARKVHMPYTREMLEQDIAHARSNL